MRDSLEYNSSIPNVIWDTDMGGDTDDLHDFANLCGYHKQGMVNIIGVSLSHGWDAGDLATAFFRFSGIPNAQVWCAGNTRGGDSNNTPSIAAWKGGAYPATYLGTVAGYRKCLASARNNSVIIFIVDAFPLTGLLASTADIYSPLTGAQLIAQKVREVVWAAGNFGGTGFSCTSATPGVLTVGTNILNGTPVTLSVLTEGGGTILPAGFNFGQTYYVVNSNNSTTVELSATLGGSPINTTSTGSATGMLIVYTGGNYEYNFGGTDMVSIASVWPANVPFIFAGIEQCGYGWTFNGISTNAPTANISPSSSPFMCDWNISSGDAAETAYSWAGFYYALDNIIGAPVFTLGGKGGSIASPSPSGNIWSQSPSGPYSYIVGNEPASPLSLAQLAICSNRRSTMVAAACLGTTGNDPPTNTVLPVITGTAQVGQTLTCSTGTWFLASSFTYQWIWGDTSANISGATSSTYSPVTGDLTHTLECKVTGTGGGGSVTVTTSATAAVIAAYSLTGTGTVNPTGPINLTTLGTTDWIAWGNGAATNVSRKATGGSVIGALTGLVSPSSDNNTSVGLTWTDGATSGTSVATATNEKYSADTAGTNTISFTAPAGLATHTLYVYADCYSANCTLTAHLSDSSSPDYVSTALSGWPAWFSAAFVLTYHAASNGQTLTVSLVGGNGNAIAIFGAALV